MEYSFKINEKLLQALDEYHKKTMLMEYHTIEKKPFNGVLKDLINDDLIYNVPIYDMGSRKYASFCSFTEAIWNKENDVKGNGINFVNCFIENELDWFILFYLFRLCGSGINYKPKTNDLFSTFIGTHGFGNFWIINSLLNKKFKHEEWLNDLKNINKPFTDNKGYLLPQFSFKNQTSNHLKKFILEYSIKFITSLYNKVKKQKLDIYQVTDLGNNWLNNQGFKKQNFVLTAFAADLSEYFPNYVNPNGLVYAGTNATRCIKTIFPKINKKVSEFDYINDVLRFQSARYCLKPIDCEDSRNCDVVRYFLDYQSKYHIKKNNGKIYTNNSILKKIWNQDQYRNFQLQLQK